MKYQDIVDALRALPFEERANAAEAAGLTVACCNSCGCYAGADYCHPTEDARLGQEQGECSTECPVEMEQEHADGVHGPDYRGPVAGCAECRDDDKEGNQP